MKLAIPYYWGFDHENRAKGKNAVQALRYQAEKLVARMPKAEKRWEKSIAFQKYFIAFLRLRKGSTYRKFLEKDNVEDYVWSFALFLARNQGYPQDLLEIDWREAIEDDKLRGAT